MSGTIVDSVSLPKKDELIGNLKIIDVVAAGGTGIVYKAINEQLEVTRAIKIIKPGCDDRLKESFLTEAKISAHLSHPNIVKIFNTDVYDKCQPYIEMEFIDGKTLSQIIKKHGSIPTIVAVSIIVIIAKALEYAYEQKITVYGQDYHGLVHRDIKPENIIIRNDGVVKLVDFGIALPGGISNTTGLNITGSMPYVSPEQLNNEKLDSKTDIYSLGCVLYEMISGKKTFDSIGITGLLSAKIKGRYRTLHDCKKSVSKEVSSIVDKCVHVDRARRFNRVEELIVRLTHYIEDYNNETPSEIIKKWLLFKKVPKKKNIILHDFKPAIIIFVIAVLLSVVVVHTTYKKSNVTEIRIPDTDPLKTLTSNVVREVIKANESFSFDSVNIKSIVITE